MRPILDDIAELRAKLAANANERELLEIIAQKLSSLRASYRGQKEEFTSEIIDFLKSLTTVKDALRDFVDALDDRAWVRTRDDSQELAARLQELVERLRPHLVSRRAEKELREIVERSRNLPFAVVAQADEDYRRRMARLEQHAPLCHKCQNKMALRESQHGLFWGCSTFPQCFSRKWLTKEENASLNL